MTTKQTEVLVLQDDHSITRLIGVDCGTMNIVLAEKSGDSKVEISSVRNMYLPLDKSHLSMAEMSNIDYVESDEGIFIVGEDAKNFGNMFNKKVCRPMSGGLISPTDVNGIDILALIMRQLVGTTKNGTCIYSVPAPSLDVSNNISYHESVFQRIFNELGFKAISFNEARAIVYSQCKDDKFTGLAFSFGAGMVNVSLCYASVPIIEFSVARSGDWIDENVAAALGIVQNRVTSIKENGTILSDFNIGNKRERRIREAIVVYYRSVIQYVLKNVVEKLEKETGDLELPSSLPIIVSGGTSMATGFLDLFKEELAGYPNFPLKISEVRHAKDPLTCVSEGLLIKGLLMMSENK